MTILYFYCCVYCHIDRERKNEHNPAEIILALPNMWTYQNLCVAHVRHIDDDLLDKHY